MLKCRTGRKPKPPKNKRNRFINAAILKGVAAFFSSTENYPFLLSPPNYIPSAAKSASDEKRMHSLYVGIWRFWAAIHHRLTFCPKLLCDNAIPYEDSTAAHYGDYPCHFDFAFDIGLYHKAEPFKKISSFAVADFNFHVFLRRKGGNHHPAPVRREGR